MERSTKYLGSNGPIGIDMQVQDICFFLPRAGDESKIDIAETLRTRKQAMVQAVYSWEPTYIFPIRVMVGDTF